MGQNTSKTSNVPKATNASKASNVPKATKVSKATKTTKTSDPVNELDLNNQIAIKYGRQIGSPTYWGSWPVSIGEYSNSLIPIQLKNELISHVTELINDKTKLNHRNMDLLNKNTLNNIQIVDIIEPHNIGTVDDTKHKIKVISDDLFTKMTASNSNSNSNIQNDLFTKMTASNSNIQNDINPWIPTVFRLNNDTKKYEIISDIVDLPKFIQNNNSLYKVIENIFNKMEPNIRKILSKYPIVGKSGNSNLQPWINSNIKFNYDNNTDNYSEYNVVVKMTDYQFLDQNSSSYGGGNYHSEGFEEENIRCVALYYFDISSNVDGGNLSFMDPTYKWRVSSEDTDVYINDNITVFFTNKEPYLHRVNKMNIVNSGADPIYCDKNGVNIYGTRKILGFFVTENSSHNTENIIVNYQYKIILIINYFIRNINTSIDINNDIMNTLKLFICGDMKYIKQKCDNYRKQRYQVGNNIMDFKDKIIKQEERADFGKCD